MLINFRLSFSFSFSLSCLLLFALAPRSAWAHEIEHGEPLAHASWDRRDGLPQDAVYAIAETPDGYLWIGTAGGLARFDGVRFTAFESHDVPELTNHFVRALEVDRAGALWIGTDGGGLVRYEGGRFQRFGEDAGIPHGRVVSLETDGRDGIWVGTYGAGVVHWRAGETRLYDERSGLPDTSVFALARDGDSLWIGTQNGGIARIEDGEVVEQRRKADGLPSDYVYALALDPEGALWVGTAEGLARIEDGRIDVLDTDDGLPSPIVLSLLALSSREFWIGTYRGSVVRRDDRIFALYDHHQLSDDTVRALFEDRHGHLWIGTGLGLDRLARGPFVTHLSSTKTAFVEAEDGSLWVGSFEGLYRLRPDGSVIEHWDDTELVSRAIWHGALDAGGRLWIGTPEGLQRIDPEGPTPGPVWTTENGLPADSVFFVLPASEDPSENLLWLGTSAGVALLRDGVVERTIGEEDGLPGDNVRSLLLDRSDRLWVGTTAGLGRLVFDESGALAPGTRHFTADDGLTSHNAWALRESPSGEVWIATRGGGLVRYRDDADGGRLDAVTARHGLPDDGLCNIFFDDHGDAWIASIRGVFRVSLAALEAVADGRASRVSGVLFDTSDGMADAMCSSLGPADSQTRDGRLWFSTFDGIAVLDPRQLEKPSAKPRPVLESVHVEGRPVPLEPTVSMTPDDHTLEIRYTALGVRDPHRLRFRHRLTPFESKWNEVGDRRTAYYTRPAPGRYRFEMAVKAADSAWRGPVSFDLVVEPAWHQALVFRLALLAGLVAFTGFLFRSVHLERYTSLLRRMQTEIATRNEELAAKNLELERFADSVAHDLRNPLFTIQGSLELLDLDLQLGKTEDAREGIGRAHEGARRLEQRLGTLLELSRAGRVIGDPEPVDLAKVIDQVIEELGAALDRRDMDVRVDPDLPTVRGDARRLTAVFQNLLENAIKYSGETTTPRVEISARRDGERVVCRVADHGVGIAPENLDEIFGLFRQLDSRAEGSGIGLALVRRVIEAHGGTIRAESAGLGRGTSFVFTLPAA